MTNLFFHPIPSEGGGSRTKKSSSGQAASRASRTEDPRTVTNKSIGLIIEAAPSALGEKLQEFKRVAQQLFSNKSLAPRLREAAAEVRSGSKENSARKARAFITLVLSLEASSSTQAALKWGLRHIPAIFAQGAEHAERFTKMAQAVADPKGVAEETKFSRARNLPRLFAAFNPGAGVYSGTSYALEQFCTKFAISDPFKAVAQAQVRWPLRSEVQGGVSGEKIKADSTGGVMTTSSVYRVSRRGDVEAPPFICGIEALTSIMSAFHVDRKTREEWTESRDRKRELEHQLGEVLKKKLLVELLGEPIVDKAEALAEDEPGAAVSDEELREKSHSLRRKQAILDELNAEIKAAFEQREGLSAARRGLLPAHHRPGYQVELQTTGVWLKWFERHLKEEPLAIPEHIEHAYRLISDPHAHLSPKERDYYLRGLVLYQARRSMISADLALADVRSDIKWYEQFSQKNPGDPLCEKFGEPSVLIAHAQDLLRTRQAEISLTQLQGAEASLQGLMRLRAERNESIFSSHSAELEKILERCRTLFKVSSPEESALAWRADSSGESVPMERLRETSAGVVLSREDFWAVRELERFRDFTLVLERHPGAKGGFDEIPIVDFERMVYGALVAGRKLEHFSSLLTPEVAATFNARVADPSSDAERALKEKTLRGGKVKLVEELLAEPRQVVANGLERISAYAEAFNETRRIAPLLLRMSCRDALRFGLCHEEDAKPTRDVVRVSLMSDVQGASLTSVSEVQGTLDKINALRANPLLSAMNRSTPAKRWFSPADVELVTTIVGGLREVSKKLEQGEIPLEKLEAFLKQHEGCVFLQGGIRVSPSIKFDVRARRLAQVTRPSQDQKERIRWKNEQPMLETFPPGLELQSRELVISFYHRGALEAFVRSVEDSVGGTVDGKTPWVRWDNLPVWWKEAAHKLSTARELGALQRSGVDHGTGSNLFPSSLSTLQASERETWFIFGNDVDFSRSSGRRAGFDRPVASDPDKLWVSREVVGTVASLAQRFGLRLRD